MIIIKITPEEISIKGHAGYAPHGFDIVCEAVSALTQTLISSISTLTDDRPNTVLESGNFKLDRRDLRADAQLLVRSFLLGVGMLAEAYDEYIKLTEH